MSVPSAPVRSDPIPLPPGLTFVERDWLSANHVFARGDDGCVLVDTGYCTRRDLTLAIADRLLAGDRLIRIVNTHGHSDHVGGNAVLKARHGCRISIPAGMAEAVRLWQEERLHYATLGQTCDRFEADDTYAAGDTLRLANLDWQVIGSPGHDMDSLLLYQPEHRILIAADALWENGFGIVFPEFFDEPGFAAQAATLEAIGELDIATVIPGHGRMFQDTAGALAIARDRLAHFRSHPERHANLALKVGLAFMLLDRQRMPLASLATLYGQLPLIERINARFYQRDPAELTQQVVAALVRAGSARIDGPELVAPAA